MSSTPFAIDTRTDEQITAERAADLEAITKLVPERFLASDEQFEAFAEMVA